MKKNRKGIKALCRAQLSLLVALFSLFMPDMSFAGSKEVGTFYTGDVKILNYPQEVWGYGNRVGGATCSAPDLVEIIDQSTTAAEIRVIRAYAGTSTRVAITVDYYEAKYNYKRQSYVFWLTVKPIPIEMNTTSINLNEYETYQLSYKGKVLGKGTPSGTWSTSNYSVATVSSNGLVTAKGGGTATITATTVDGETASCLVSVTAVSRDPTSVSIPNKLTVYAKEQATITPTLTPSNAQTTFTWYSDNTSIAKVSGGTVEGVSEGTTYVYCKTANGLQSNKCEVSVYYRTPTEISVSPQSITMQMNQTKQLSYTVKPSNAKYTVTWSSENPNIASVSSSGLVTSKSGGSTRIVVSTDNGKKAYCNVTVQPDPQNVTLSQSSMVLTYGTSRQLSYTIYPSDAYKSLTWLSDNTAVARVASDGTVTAVGAGTAVISVTTHNGKSATCLVEVPEPNFYLVVWLKDGRKTVCHLKEKPKVEYADDKFTLKSTDKEMEYNAEDVQKFTLADNPDGIDGIEAVKAEGSLTMRHDSNMMLISGCKPQAATFVYTTSGACVGRFTADAQGNTVVTLSSLPSGMLIVKTETITYKIMKK